MSPPPLPDSFVSPWPSQPLTLAFPDSSAPPSHLFALPTFLMPTLHFSLFLSFLVPPSALLTLPVSPSSCFTSLLPSSPFLTFSPLFSPHSPLVLPYPPWSSKVVITSPDRAPSLIHSSHTLLTFPSYSHAFLTLHLPHPLISPALLCPFICPSLCTLVPQLLMPTFPHPLICTFLPNSHPSS